MIIVVGPMSGFNFIGGYLIVRLGIVFATVICYVSPFMPLSMIRFRGVALASIFGNFKHVVC